MECLEEEGLYSASDTLLAWKEFFGSSVSLAPSLISIYDKAATVASSGECDCIYPCRLPSAPDVPTRANDSVSQSQSPQPSRLYRQPDHIDRRADYGVGAAVPTYGGRRQPASERRTQAGKPPPPPPTSTSPPDNILTCCSRSSQCTSSSSSSSAGGRSQARCYNGFGSVHRGASTATPPKNSARSRSSFESTAVTTMNDFKKRPLSIRSTSSNASSTSVVAVRNRRKKLATDVVAAAGGAGDGCKMAAVSDGGTGCGDLSTVSELRVRDALTSGYRTTVGNSGPEMATTMMMTDDDDDQVEPEVDEDGGSLATTDDCTSTRANSSELMSPIGDLPSSSSGPDVELSTGWRCYVGRVVAELVDTERTYVRDLNDVIQGYLGCCINNISNNGGSCFSNEDVAILFGNIKDIHLFNSNFLASLDQCQLDPVRIANCFMDHSQGFTIYSDYCTNYPRSLAVLDKLMQDSVAANLFWRQQVSLQHELPVGSYLLKPVQRLFKYQLLLQSLLSHCVEDSDASVAVSVALKSMVGVARSINEWKRDHERAIRVAEMQGLLDDGTHTDLSSLGELLLEDKFKLSGAKTYRHLFLFQKGLLIAKRKEDGNFQIKASITCNNLMLVETVQKAPLSFNLIPFNNPRMQFTVQARTMEQKRQWCCQIKKLILDSYESVIPDKAKQLVLTLVHNQDEASDASSAEHINSSTSSVAISQCSDRGKVHRKSAGYIAVLQRSESVNSSFRSYEATPEGSHVTPINSGESSTSHSNQSLHSLRGGTAAWRSSWCSSTGSPHDAASSMNGHGGGGIAPTAIAEIVSDEDSPKRTPPNGINYVSTADAFQHHHTRTSEVTSGSSRAAASRDAFDVAVVRAKSDLMEAKPLRSASVDRRPMQSASVAEGGRLNGSSRYPLTGSQSVRVSDYVPRPFVRQNTPTASGGGDGWQRSSSKKSMTVFGVASHVEPSATTLDRSCERLLRLCTPPRGCGLPANNGGKSDVSSLGLMTSRSAAGSVGHRSTPPRAVVESDLEEEITGEVRVGPATSQDSDYGVNRLRRETSLTDASFDHVTGHMTSHVTNASNPSQSHGNLADDQGTWSTQLSHLENGCGSGSGKVKDDSNVLMKSLYFEQRQASNGGPRTKRSGSYHGLAHHSVTVTDSKTRRESTTSNVKSPVDSFKNALTTLAEKFSGRRSGTNVSTATPPVLAEVERGRQQGDGCVLSLDDSNQGKTANPVVVVERGGIVSRLIARASGRFPKRRSKSGDRADGGRRRHRDLSTADVTRVIANDVCRPSERSRLGVNLRSRSPEVPRRTTGAPCSRSKSVDLDLCETTDFDASRVVGNGVDESSYDDDEDDGTICQLICGGPSWSDGINQKPPMVINKLESKDAGSGGTTRRHQVPFIDDSESDE